MHRRLCVAVLLTLGMAMAIASPVAASVPRVGVTGERTYITPSPAALAVLSSNGVAVTPTGGATLSDGSLVLKITGGFVTTANSGEIFHSGGVTFTRGSATLSYRDFRLVRAHDVAFLSALVGTHRVVYARVTHFLVKIASRTEAVVTGELVFTREGAGQFNRLIGSSVTKEGAEFGKLRSIIRIAAG